MAHLEHFEFFEQVKLMLPIYFRNSKVLDIGSLDINGCNRPLFQNCEYVGLDIGRGKNVDVVSIAHEYRAPSESFDVVISSNCFEHDMYYRKSLTNAVRVLKKSGLLLFVCRTMLNGWDERTGEHGTINSDTFSSPLTSAIPGWNTYYKNLSIKNVNEVLFPDLCFYAHELIINNKSGDMCFWGIKCK